MNQSRKNSFRGEKVLIFHTLAHLISSASLSDKDSLRRALSSVELSRITYTLCPFERKFPLLSLHHHLPITSVQLTISNLSASQARLQLTRLASFD